MITIEQYKDLVLNNNTFVERGETYDNLVKSNTQSLLVRRPKHMFDVLLNYRDGTFSIWEGNINYIDHKKFGDVMNSILCIEMHIESGEAWCTEGKHWYDPKAEGDHYVLFAGRSCNKHYDERKEVYID